MINVINALKVNKMNTSIVISAINVYIEEMEVIFFNMLIFLHLNVRLNVRLISVNISNLIVTIVVVMLGKGAIGFIARNVIFVSKNNK